MIPHLRQRGYITLSSIDQSRAAPLRPQLSRPPPLKEPPFCLLLSLFLNFFYKCVLLGMPFYFIFLYKDHLVNCVDFLYKYSSDCSFIVYCNCVVKYKYYDNKRHIHETLSFLNINEKNYIKSIASMGRQVLAKSLILSFYPISVNNKHYKKFHTRQYQKLPRR